ncbi:Oidioi.mRNA.OKI2018_I69.chr2.g6761.t1.cds [Oikopleura dioica]|uniref:Oidioi.mRNA.OKI2018_I69.chr2.g6761.t1.cds n=1 Tax=Oikopleura dioica TaxID=34765 RepID=A0ABN7TA61_OIKDI|nr:Oidioi.mRNA.OKI2018_I69.chr2.g6761.t1.cds [Oikopleura dioica]
MQASGLLRNVRNVVHNYTEVEIKVREATSNDPWGPSSSIMAEIADLTYNMTAFPEIMGIIWKRLSDTGKNWRHVYKSLVLLDYLVKTGAERVQNQCKENIYSIQTLKDFQYVDNRDYKDHGKNVRERATQLVSLLKDEERLRNERDKSLKNKERFSKQTTAMGSHTGHVTGMGSSGRMPDSSYRPGNSGEEELQLQLALAMSKEEAEAKEKQDREDQVRIELAIKESLKNEQAAAGPSQSHPPPQQVQAQAPQSAVDDLLNLDFGNEPALPVQQNPWGQGASGTPSPRDPFGAPAAADPFGAPQSNAQSTPFGNPALPASSDPFGASDPWGSKAPATSQPEPPKAADPFGDAFGSSAAPVAAPVSSAADPFGAPSSSDPFGSAAPAAQPPATATGSDPFGASDPFGSPSNNNTQPSSDLFSLPSADTNANAFDMGGMQSSLPSEQAPKKTAQSFLGSASGLVNLDALVSRPKQVNTNPFGNTPSGSNPFQINTPGPSMNEMQRNAQQQSMGLQQPMAPSPVGGMNPMMSQPQAAPVQNIFGAPAMANPWGQSIGGNDQKQSNNPFL